MEVRYEYEVKGVKYSSMRIRQVEAAPTLHFDDAVQKQQQYPTGSSRTFCFVNPAAPDEAVLQHGSRAALYSIWFPLLFVLGGCGMLRVPYGARHEDCMSFSSSATISGFSAARFFSSPMSVSRL